MPLERSWVERIHVRMLARYGSAWIGLYRGIDPEVVKEDWANELDGMSGEALRYALDNLPADKPPNVAQFKLLARNRPRAHAFGLPPPDSTPEEKERVRAMLAKARDAVTKQSIRSGGQQ